MPVELDVRARREDVLDTDPHGDRHIVLGEHGHEAWHGAHESDGEAHGELRRVHLAANALVALPPSNPAPALAATTATLATTTQIGAALLGHARKRTENKADRTLVAARGRARSE